MMLANVPAVIFGEAVTRVVPLKYVRIGAAIIFALIGLWVIWSALQPSAPVASAALAHLAS
jgi:Ca2+/H+ antiporter, TMEM165/GDT1 family